jgi:hypothetical protein
MEAVDLCSEVDHVHNMVSLDVLPVDPSWEDLPTVVAAVVDGLAATATAVIERTLAGLAATHRVVAAPQTMAGSALITPAPSSVNHPAVAVSSVA